MKRHLLFVLLGALLLGMTACHDNASQDNNGNKASNEKTGNTAQVNVAVSEQDQIHLLSDSIARDETRVDLYLRRAQLYMKDGNLSKAMMDVNTAIQLDPKSVDALIQLSDLYYLLGNESNILASLNKALEIDPYDARVMVKLAQFYLLRQDYNLAFGYIDNALKLDSYNPAAYFVKGMTYMAKQDTVLAMKNFLIAREQDATFFEPQRQISEIYRAQHDPMTESFMRSMMVNFPDRPEVRYELALFLQDNGNPEEALLHYDTLLVQQPSDSLRFFYNQGYVYFVYLEDNEKALECFNRSLQGDHPNYIGALYNKGHVYERMGDYSQAKAIYNQVLSQFPNYQLAVDGMNRVTNQAN